MDILSNLINQNNQDLFNNENDELDGEFDETEDLDDELDDSESEVDGDTEEDDVNEEDVGEEVDEDDEEDEVEEAEIVEEVDNNLEEQDNLLNNENNVEIQMKNDGNFSISKKKVPNTPAKDLNVGDILLSENDNNNYVVTSDKNGRKRWKKM
tara:strand:- start:2128 stop:2586 length:459 start_codon:yes stop_codon:yes gene_type:complete